MDKRFILLLAFIYLADCEDLFVNLTGKGIILGSRELFFFPGSENAPRVDTTVDYFVGISFAEKPLGKLRFAKPVPKEPWEPEIMNATYERTFCWQAPLLDKLNTFYGFIPPQTEDCLYLNVWSPNISHSGYPVLFWIHGGGFTLGSAYNNPYEGDALAAINDVVVVSTNYRLNGFGFLATDDKVIPGNFGMWDQLEALIWVQDHIHEFGGDPTKVTIFGQSAGGASVGFHLTSPYSWNYFNNAILMSGSMSVSWATELNGARYREKAFQAGAAVGCGDARDSMQLLDCLRGVDEYDLAREFSVNSFVTVVDGDFIEDNPRLLLERQRIKKCEIMIGSTKDDGTLDTAFRFAGQVLDPNPYCSRERFHRIVNDYGRGSGSDLVANILEQYYIDWSKEDNKSANYFYENVHVKTDETFLCPVDHTARFYSRFGLNVYRWMFNYIPKYSIWPRIPIWKGAAHGDDIEFVFGSAFKERYYSNRTYPEEERILSLNLMRYYTNFAKTGNPNEGGDNDGQDGGETYWDLFTEKDLIFMELKPEMTEIRGYRADFCNLWNNFLPKVKTFTGAFNYAYGQWSDQNTRWTTNDNVQWSEEWDKFGNDPCV